MTKKSAEFIFQPGIIGRFLGAGPLNTHTTTQYPHHNTIPTPQHNTHTTTQYPHHNTKSTIAIPDEKPFFVFDKCLPADCFSAFTQCKETDDNKTVELNPNGLLVHDTMRHIKLCKWQLSLLFPSMSSALQMPSRTILRCLYETQLVLRRQSLADAQATSRF